MKKKSKIIKKIIIIIAVLLLMVPVLKILYFYLAFKIGISNLEKQHDINVAIELEHREDNLKILMNI